jgi:hypothetical protein
MNNPKPIRPTPDLISRLPKREAEAKEKREAEAKEKREAKEAWDRKERDRRYASIDEMLKKHPKMTSGEDRKIVARNLGEILTRFEREGKGRKEAVLRAAHMGEKGNSTKQLYHYVLSGPTSPEKRIARLVKRTDGYIKIAKTAADIAGWDKQDVLVDLFRRSSYGSDTPTPASDLPDYLFDLNDILDRLSNWLVRDTRIQWYYETLRKSHVCDDWGNFVVALPVWSVPDTYGRSPADYGKAIPGIRLYRLLSAELPVEFVSSQKLDRWDSSGDEPPPGATIEHLTFRRYFDIRLGLAPIGASGSIRPVFDQRRVDELWQVRERTNSDEGNESIEEWRAYATGAPTTEWSPGDIHRALDPPVAIVEQLDDSFDELGLEGGWTRCATLDHESIPANEFFEGMRGSPLNEVEARLLAVQDQFVEEVDPLTCKKYLHRKIDERIECDWNVVWSALMCPADIIAARIESAFHLKEIENRLDGLLRQEIERRCSLLDACLEHRKRLIDANKAKLFSRWDV